MSPTLETLLRASCRQQWSSVVLSDLCGSVWMDRCWEVGTSPPVTHQRAFQHLGAGAGLCADEQPGLASAHDATWLCTMAVYGDSVPPPPGEHEALNGTG